MIDWRPDPTNGAVIGAYICQGYVYGANIGSISLGSGSPADYIRYRNNSATDYGIKFVVDPNNRAHGLLRGYAYGANIGWISFEDAGHPYVIISNGQLQGYAWSANVGWINLGDLNVFVQTDSIDPGVDTDGDRLPDAWEYSYFGSLSVDPNADSDGDGETDLAEYRSGTNPADPNSVLRSGKALNISTRLGVRTGENVLIGGFIITGTEQKTVLIRGLGPSLGAAGVSDALPDPVLELHDSSSLLASNDNWRDSQADAISATGIPPADDREAAIVQALSPGAYTAIVSGKSNSTGIGLVEVYDLSQSAVTELANISTRGFVSSGDDVIIGGFIVGGGAGNDGAGSAKVLIRAIGPSLASGGVAQPLTDPALELRDSNGSLVVADDNWKDFSGVGDRGDDIPPSDDREAAIVRVMSAGAFTAVVRGNNGLTGVALVEIYEIP